MHPHDSLEGALGRGEIKVKAENHLLKLRPILLNDLLRVSGRLSHAPLDFEEKYPVILPGKHHYTTILVERNTCRTNSSWSEHCAVSSQRTRILDSKWSFCNTSDCWIVFYV